MYNKGYGQHKAMCPYCGGMHPPGQCPAMYPPMPMPPVPTPPAMPPMGGMMPGMEEMMHHHTMLLEHIAKTVDEIHHICEAMQTGMAKG